jgi:hypothetical protein
MLLEQQKVDLAELIQQAATSQDEHDALTFQQSVQFMTSLNNSTPIARIIHLNGLIVCQTNDGTVVVPIQWDLRSVDTDDREFHHRTQGIEIYHTGFWICHNSHRSRLTRDRPGPRHAGREGYDQSAPRPAAMKTKPPRESRCTFCWAARRVL